MKKQNIFIVMVLEPFSLCHNPLQSKGLSALLKDNYPKICPKKA